MQPTYEEASILKKIYEANLTEVPDSMIKQEEPSQRLGDSMAFLLLLYTLSAIIFVISF